MGVPVDPLAVGEPDELAEVEGLPELDALLFAGELLAGLLRADELPRVSVGAALLVEIEVLEIGGTTAPGPETLATGEATSEDVVVLVRGVLRWLVCATVLLGAAGPGCSAACPDRSRKPEVNRAPSTSTEAATRPRGGRIRERDAGPAIGTGRRVTVGAASSDRKTRPSSG